MQSRQVPDITRFDVDTAGNTVLHVGAVRVVPVFDCGGTAFVISRAHFADAMRAAYQLGWNGHVAHARDTLTQLAREIGQ